MPENVANLQLLFSCLDPFTNGTDRGYSRIGIINSLEGESYRNITKTKKDLKSNYKVVRNSIMAV